jgi:hypothetical protein
MREVFSAISPATTHAALILRSREAASRRMAAGEIGTSWFETALRASSP